MFERITRREEADLFVAWMAIAVSFAIINIAPYGILGLNIRIDLFNAVLYFGIALITVGIGFILHEMAHKFAAIRFGYWAEFRKDNVMLLIAVVMAALVGFVFAAPGATVIYSTDGRMLTREQNGMISAAGPATNLLLCIPFAVLIMLSGGPAALHSVNGSLLAIVGLAGIQINAMLATFNLLPVSVLDGKKVLAWSLPAFILLIGLSVAILFGSYYFL
ncbi:MAG: peptidase M50 [Methanoregula sp.]|jgi:Zn-dependent protease|nr:peptidase M50 [Methanoregula sp.]